MSNKINRILTNYTNPYLVNKQWSTKFSNSTKCQAARRESINVQCNRKHNNYLSEIVWHYMPEECLKHRISVEQPVKQNNKSNDQNEKGNNIERQKVEKIYCPNSHI